MGGESCDNAFHDVAVSARSASNVDVRFGVEWPALIGQPAKGCCAIGSSKERARVATPGPIGKHLDRRIEPDSDRPLVENPPGARIDKGPAARRDDASLSLDEPGDQAPFSVAKIGFAETFEDFSGRVAGGVFDLRITVDERQSEPPREAPSDGRLAGAHQADKDDWTVEAGNQLFHAQGYTAGRKVGQKPNP